jgi:hypothetical protein
VSTGTPDNLSAGHVSYAFVANDGKRVVDHA